MIREPEPPLIERLTPRLILGFSLMALGMMMMPPAMVSLPFKMLLFGLVDGWGLVISSLVSSYGGSG